MWDIIRAVQERFHLIGRGEELHRALLAAAAGKHILFEGPVGVGKTVIASALAEHLHRKFAS